MVIPKLSDLPAIWPFLQISRFYFRGQLAWAHEHEGGYREERKSLGVRAFHTCGQRCAIIGLQSSVATVTVCSGYICREWPAHGYRFKSWASLWVLRGGGGGDSKWWQSKEGRKNKYKLFQMNILSCTVTSLGILKTAGKFNCCLPLYMYAKGRHTHVCMTNGTDHL